jgi:hypothetical protein
MSPSEQDDGELATLELELEKFARDLVTRAGGCPPFGGMIDEKGEFSLLIAGATVGADDSPLTVDKIFTMVRREAASGKARAAGVVNMAYVPDETGKRTTAIVINLHHRSGRCVDFAIPFTMAASGTPRYGEPMVGIGKTQLV